MSALQFLAKKSWHTATLRNNEKVWAAEKKAAEEAKRLQELKKQLEEERELEQLRRLEAESGRLSSEALKRRERLDWMYEVAGPNAGASQMKALEPGLGQGPGASTENAREREDYLLGKREVKDAPPAGRSAHEAAHENPPLRPRLVDSEAKLREDPLMAIKMKERAAVEAVRRNPVRMAEIRRNRDEKLRRKAERAARREERADRRAAREMRHGH